MHRKKMNLIFVVLAMFCFCLCAYAGDVMTGSPVSLPTTQTVLENGMNVLIAEMPQSGLVSIYALVKAGSAIEGKYLGAGITHFIEHMLFKGTETRKVGDIAQEIQRLGGTINASTGKDHTIFTITVPSDKFEQGLDVLSDMIQHPRFDPQELEKEQQVVAKEIRMHKDLPENYLSELVFDAVYQTHPYKVPIIGYEDVFLKLTREDVLEYYKRVYVPNNIILSIAGGVRKDEVMPVIQKSFERFERQCEVVRNLPREPQQITPRRRVEQYPTDLTRFSLSFQGVRLSHPDMFALDVLAMIIGQGQSSRLYEDLFKKKGLVQSIYASNYTPVDTGVFEIECVLERDKIDAAIKNIFSHIQDIQGKGVSPAELKKAQRQVVSRYLNDYQRTSDFAYHAAMDQAFIGDYDFYRKYMEGIQHVTSRDIKKVAQKYLKQARSCLVILESNKAEQPPAQNMVENPVQAEVKQITLENGLTLLLKETHKIPLVSIFLAANGGVRAEPPDKNGLSALTSQTWTKGTKTLRAAQIAREIESRGASWGGFSGHDSIGLSLNVLSQDIDFGLDLLADAVINPAFDQGEVEKERENLLTAILARNDSIFKQTMMALQERLFTNYYLGRTELGTAETVKNVTRQDIVDYYAAHIKPDNMVLSVYGDINSAEVERILKRKFARLKRRPFEMDAAVLPAPPVSGEHTLELDKSQAMVMVGFRAVGLSHPERWGIELLTHILGSSFQGRIFNKIREDFGQSYALGGFYFPSTDEGMMVYYVATTNEYAAKIKDMLFEIFDQIKENPVSASELDDMKSYLKGRQQRSLETNAALSARAAMDTLYGLGHDHYKLYNDEIDKVSPRQISSLANAYLNENQGVVIITWAGESKDR